MGSASRQARGFARLPQVETFAWRGLLAGVEFVADLDTREPFPRSERFAERFTDAARDAGLVVWPNVGHVEGKRGDIAMLAPPFIVTDEELDELIRRFSSALEAMLGSTRSRAQRVPTTA